MIKLMETMGDLQLEIAQWNRKLMLMKLKVQEIEVILESFNTRASDSVGSTEKLSSRQTEIVKLIAEDLGVSAIAKKLNISAKTVEAHREQIRKKFGIKSADELREKAKNLLPS